METAPPSAPPIAPAPPQPGAPRRWRRRAARTVEALVVLAAIGGLGVWCSVPDTAQLAERNPTTTAFIELRRSQAAAAGKPFTLRWQWRPIGEISRYLRAAVIYAEDYNFYRHDGIDWKAIEHAIAADWNRGSFAIGGSTITQQLAKNLYLSPSRSVVRKAREMAIAFSLEADLSKQRILELYLNVVEWGDGVFGAEAAARRWFRRSAQSLTPAEAIRLAIALPNPIRFTPGRTPGGRDPALTRKAVRLVRMLRMQGLVNAEQERTALDQLGAPGERVLPDREVAAAAAAAEPAEPAEAGSLAPPPDEPAVPDETAPALPADLLAPPPPPGASDTPPPASAEPDSPPAAAEPSDSPAETGE